MPAPNDVADTARQAMSAVQRQDRATWLALFAADARVEDPVGHLPPIAGREELGAFWDNAIGGLDAVTFDVTRTWRAGDREAMLLATVTLESPAGKASYDGAFNYRIDGDGRIASLRGFWDLPAVAAQLGG